MIASHRWPRLGLTTIGSAPSRTTIAGAAISLVSLPFALFGLGQIGSTALTQLHGPAHITDFVAIFSGPRLLLTSPSQLYAPGAAAALDHWLTSSDRFDRPFSFLPQAAIELSPLAALPFGVAYLIWLAVGVISLALSIRLLAPRSRLWPLLVLLFLPAQLGLIMGQTSAVTLLALCLFIRILDRRPALAGLAIAFSPAMWKPQLVAPALGMALVVGARWRTLAGVVVVPLAFLAAFTSMAGISWIGDYRAQAAEMWSLISAGSSVESAGQTLLGLAQAVLGAGPIAVAVAIGGGAVLYGAIAVVWWKGLDPDAERRKLQLAVLPIASIVAAPHALGYDLTLWLASAWLLLSYVNERVSARPLVIWLCLSGWACANFIVLTENELGFPWAALHGLVTVAVITWLHATHPRCAAIQG